MVLRIIPAVCAQVLLCRVGKHPALKAIPLLITGALAFWIVCLYFVPHLPDWNGFWGLFWEYMSPFAGCLLVHGLFQWRE